MSLKKTGTDYESFAYLTAGEDYPAFELAPEVGRVEEHLVELSSEEEVRVERLLNDHVMISLHEHTNVFPKDIHQTPTYVGEGRTATAFRGLADSHWDAIFDNLLDGICTIESKSGWKWNDVLHDLGMRLCDLAHQDFLIHCKGVDDILRAHDERRIAWIASLEGSAMIENELDRIEILYGLGVRAMGIAYSEANALGSGLREPRDGGLTVFGRQAVERMNRVGMLIDVSHCGDQTSLDVIEASEKPIVISHIGARALWDSNRLAPDEVISACAAKGGLIGVEAAPHTTITSNRPEHSVESVMEHFEYIKDLVGIDHVSFGPDSVYGDHVGLHHVYTANLSIKESRAKSAGAATSFPRVEYVKGFENPSECSKNIPRWLVRNGYSDEEIVKVMGGNALRLLREVWH
jgi:membrane dipeptidase